MFQIKSHHKKAPAHSRSWYDQLHVKESGKRVVAKHHTAPYHRETLAESIHNACMKSFGFSGEAELTALKVCQHVEAWLEDKEEVTKEDIRRIAASALQHYNPRAAYVYLPAKEYSVKEDEYGFIRL